MSAVQVQLIQRDPIKRAIAHRYAEKLADVSELTLMAEAPWAFSTYWLYTVLVGGEKGGDIVQPMVQEIL